MANKKYSDFAAGTLTPTDVLLTGNPSTGALAKLTIQQLQDGMGRADIAKVYSLLGSAVIAESLGLNIVMASGNTGNFVNQSMKVQAIYLPYATTITGIKWLQVVQGSYTANNYNGVGLYTYSAGTLTLVASSTDDGNIWKAAPGMASKAFSSQYPAAAGLYFAAHLYNQSAVVTAPQIGAFVNANGGLFALDFTNSARIVGQVTSQASLPATQAMSGVASSSISPWLGLY